MSETDEEEARAEAWLRAQGYTASRPTWLPATLKNPDFWATNDMLAPPNLWAEVKSIDPDDSTAVLGKYRDLIRAARIPPGLHGHAMMHLDPGAIEQPLRWALNCLKTRSLPYANTKISLIFIQQTRSAEQEYRIAIDSNPPTVIWARAEVLPLPLPAQIGSETLDAMAQLTTPDGRKSTARAYNFFNPGSAMQCALIVRLDPEDRPLGGIACMSGGSGQACGRMIQALEAANRQIKAACAADRPAPGLVIVTSRDPVGSDDQALQAAVYGEFTIQISLNRDHPGNAGMHHGRNGVFRPNKNTHLSAVAHLHHNAPVTFFPNPYARLPIDDGAPVFTGAVRANVEFL
jgi:hypothetical protein